MLQPDHVVHRSCAMPTSLDTRLTGPSLPVGVSRRYGPGWHALRTCFAARLSNSPVYGKPETMEVQLPDMLLDMLLDVFCLACCLSCLLATWQDAGRACPTVN